MKPRHAIGFSIAFAVIGMFLTACAYEKVTDSILRRFDKREGKFVG